MPSNFLFLLFNRLIKSLNLNSLLKIKLIKLSDRMVMLKFYFRIKIKSKYWE